MTENRTLNVIYHDRPVGRLAEMPDRRVAFQYDESWLGDGFSISPRSLPLTKDVFIPQESSREKFDGLFGVFADSLPDSWGHLLLNRYLESMGINAGDTTTLDRLAYIGRSGMGALEYVPSKEADFDALPAGLSYDTIAMECEKLLSSQPSDQLDTLYRLGASGGGTRPKIMLTEEGQEWIVKFPAGKDPAISGKREYEYSLCAKRCGITMTETGLIPSSICEGYFRTERFDRKDGEKIFGITFAGLLEADFRAPSCDYETFFRLVRSLTKDNANDTEQLFRIMCFNVLAHNRDDHTKNFTFQYSGERGWHLAPGYDLTYSDTYWGEHTTSVGGKGKDITDEDLVAAGTKAAGLSKKQCESIVEEIRQETSELDPYMRPASGRKSKHISFSESIAELRDALKGGAAAQQIAEYEKGRETQ
ncbi:MAG: type II toxin-antitoxin system HipA family toxin [Lachnospiraceae bacterium]|nr:type II toxin-antitoxin system HipA family toxin [Lachnospiraceae bacterium]